MMDIRRKNFTCVNSALDLVDKGEVCLGITIQLHLSNAKITI